MMVRKTIMIGSTQCFPKSTSEASAIAFSKLSKHVVLFSSQTTKCTSRTNAS